MGLTTDKLRSMVKKWQTLIEGNIDVKTTDGYTLRVFCIGFTRKQDMSTKKTAYAQAAQVKNTSVVSLVWCNSSFSPLNRIPAGLKTACWNRNGET